MWGPAQQQKDTHTRIRRPGEPASGPAQLSAAAVCRLLGLALACLLCTAAGLVAPGMG
jgi:hypothetical protein